MWGLYMYKCFCLAAVSLLVLSGCSKGSDTVLPPITPTPPAAQLTIAVTPTSVEPGQFATLSWSSSNATSCLASGDWTGNQALTGSQNVLLSGTKGLSFTLTCSGANGSPSQTATLGVAQGPNGCKVVPQAKFKADRRVSRHRKATSAAAK